MFKPAISGRPIYYHINPAGEFFCSTQISLLREAGVIIRENKEALPEFFVYRLVMPPRTLYKDVGQLMAGGRAVIKLHGEGCHLESVSGFEPPEAGGIHGSLRDISEQTLSLLTHSLEALNPYGEKLSILQSGGLDSSILYQLCRKLYGSEETYSTGFPFEEPTNNLEREYALSAARALRSRHVYHEFSTREYLQGLIRGIAAAEEPLHHLQSVLLHLLFGRLPQNKNIVISGEGADSSFGSLMNNRVYRINTPLIHAALGPVRLSGITALMSKRWQGRINGIAETRLGLSKSLNDPGHMLWSIGRYGNKEWVCNHFGVGETDIIEGRYSTIRLFEDRSVNDQIALLSFLGGASVTKSIWNKLGEDQGKIVHYPYGDDNLLRYVHAVPWDIKVRKPKNILREVARMTGLPRFIIERPKQSFGVSPRRWGEKGGVLEPLVALCEKVVDKREIQKMQSPEPDKAMTFWNILNYALWKRMCVDNESAEGLLGELNENPASHG
jgi:asparagine synthetase B (glutamine-hydrolysing)